eukprot:CAMPEP_0185315534 /NCGR_PEP_ID=MMETSP1363-20130426/41674_1 /TAXON_ID=38817 /ORGANISM="Gephyrocapsa oceanica, Strain RCC1303" /LENGTH=120 /DNA_ID=CAMNT_0027913651 /DNA_START=1 /DNA_END=359 /DNA_ORIENTATION=-
MHEAPCQIGALAGHSQRATHSITHGMIGGDSQVRVHFEPHSFQTRPPVHFSGATSRSWPRAIHPSPLMERESVDGSSERGSRQPLVCSVRLAAEAEAAQLAPATAASPVCSKGGRGVENG